MSISVIKRCKIHGLLGFRVEKEPRCKGGTRLRCPECKYVIQDRRRKRIRAKLISLHGGKCRKCGYDKYKGALHFHHKNPKDKKFGLSLGNMEKPWKTLVKEAAKCILRCSNCHAELRGDY